MSQAVERQGRDRRWPRAVPEGGAALLNARWHSLRGSLHSRLCPECGESLPFDDQVVHQGGEPYHPDCALVSWWRP